MGYTYLMWMSSCCRSHNASPLWSLWRVMGVALCQYRNQWPITGWWDSVIGVEISGIGFTTHVQVALNSHGHTRINIYWHLEACVEWLNILLFSSFYSIFVQFLFHFWHWQTFSWTLYLHHKGANCKDPTRRLRIGEHEFNNNWGCVNNWWSEH